MNYDRQILETLFEVGERGLSARLLAKNLYNLNLSLFFQPDLEEIYRYVKSYLRRNSRTEQSIIERTGRHGFYRLNTQHSADARQLMLKFKEQQTEQGELPQPSHTPDYSLNLFPD
jgi:hypothetical protein